MSVATLLLVVASDATATVISTSDPGVVATFVAGAFGPIGFDGVPGNDFTSGAAVSAANAVDDASDELGILFSSTGGPAVAVNRAVDAHSDPNLLAGTSLNGATVVVDYLQPIELEFVQQGTANPSTTNLVGAWLDPTGSTVQLEVFDATGHSIEIVQGNEGQFIGISTPGIARARFTFLQNNSVPGFSIDDLFVSQLPPTTTTLPPTSTTTSPSTTTTVTPTTKTSTTRTTRTSTTSTTLLPPRDCTGVPDAATFASLDCRLAALGARVEAATTDISRGREALVGQLTKARARTQQAEALCHGSDAKPALKRLKQAVRALIQFGHRLRSNTGKRGILGALRVDLIATSDAIRTDAKQLKRTLLCPSDAP